MNPRIKTRITFIASSMIWSLLLYATMMLLINWDEVSNAINNKTDITVVNSHPPQPSSAAIAPVASPANISTETHTLASMARLIRVIAGIPSMNQ